MNIRDHNSKVLPSDGRQLPRMRLVVIDDDESSSEMLKRILELAHHEVFVAGTGSEGIDLILSEIPDLALVDKDSMRLLVLARPIVEVLYDCGEVRLHHAADTEQMLRVGVGEADVASHGLPCGQPPLGTIDFASHHGLHASRVLEISARASSRPSPSSASRRR